MALTTGVERDLLAAPDRVEGDPLAADQVVLLGSILVRDAVTGYIKSGTNAVAADRVVGVASQKVNSTGLANGACLVGYRSGTFKVGTLSGAPDELSIAEVGTDVFLVDDNVVSADSDTSSRATAGKLMRLDDDGLAWVQLGDVIHVGH